MPNASPQYQIPTHLNVPDKIDLPLFGITVSLTIRQGICFLFGWSLAFHLWQQSLVFAPMGIPGTLLHWGGPWVLAFATFIVAKHEVRGRYLERWLLVLIRYYRMPRVFVWHHCTVTGEPMSRIEGRDGDGENEEDEES